MTEYSIALVGSKDLGDLLPLMRAYCARRRSRSTRLPAPRRHARDLDRLLAGRVTRRSSQAPVACNGSGHLSWVQLQLAEVAADVEPEADEVQARCRRPMRLALDRRYAANVAADGVFKQLVHASVVPRGCHDDVEAEMPARFQQQVLAVK